MKLVVDSRCVELCIRVLPAKYLIWMGNHPLLILILLKFFICENKNLNPHYTGLISGAAP